MKGSFLKQSALLFLMGALCSCTPAAAADAPDGTGETAEQTDTTAVATEDPVAENPLMYIDWIGFDKGSVRVGKDFSSADLRLFASRAWTVEYDRKLLLIEPESGPGQVDSQSVKISLREGVDWERDILNAKGYIPDAVFTAGKKTKNLSFITAIPDYPLPKDGDELTIIEYNIERGMAADKGNNFDNFVAWVKAQDPDVLLLCECNELNDESLGRLAARWGHPYAAVTVDDGWNPAITSKYPLEGLKKFTKGVVHGALTAKIVGINFICLHACASWFDSNDWYQDEPKDYDGNGSVNSFDYRLAELQNIFTQTIFAKPDESRWVLTGDLNAVSPTEKRWWDNGESYLVEHRYILSLGFWTDIMRQQNPDDPMFTYARDHDWDDARMAATESNPHQMNYERLDYFYISDALVDAVKGSHVIYDDFTKVSSDHRPITMKLIYHE